MQRNGQNPVRAEKNFAHGKAKFNQATAAQAKAAGAMQCPSCKADVPPKPGFRMRSLKCPKCGEPMHK